MTAAMLDGFPDTNLAPAVVVPDLPDPHRFGTILVDPPWNYADTSRGEKLRGYSDQHYAPLSTTDLCALPVGELAQDASVLLLWTTMPFLPDALRIIDAWDFTYVTALSWVKAGPDPKNGTVGYGVGYWFRGATELILVGKRKKSYRSQYVGLISPGLKHSRKPESIYEVAETTYPGRRLEMFARRTRPGWTSLGNECPGDGKDIRRSIKKLVDTAKEAQS